jgi:small subunit ribosomal protein S6
LTASKPTYDLVLMLDLAAPDEERAKIVSDTRTAIQKDGELVLEQNWGARALAYEIEHREQAEYHLLQLQGPPTLIASLERTLRITDGVVRHRIIKLAPGTPAAVEQSPRAAAPAAATEPAAAVVEPAVAVVAEPAVAIASEPDGASADDDALAPA